MLRIRVTCVPVLALITLVSLPGRGQSEAVSFERQGDSIQVLITERFRAAGLSWPLPAEMSESDLEERLFPDDAGVSRPGAKTPPDFAYIHQQLQGHKHTTLQLLWEEYRAGHADGYGYSRFCHHYQRFKQERDLVLRQSHRPGEKLFVDWAGATMPLYDPATGQARPAQLFVAVLGASNYTYAEATLDQQMGSWIGAHVRALEFFGGCPQLVVPDNTRTGVSRLPL